MMRTLYSGLPTYRTNKFQQDDLVFNASMTTGGYISPSRTPNAIVPYFFLPPFLQWEKRTGTRSAFGRTSSAHFTRTTGITVVGFVALPTTPVDPSGREYSSCNSTARATARTRKIRPRS